MHPPSELYKVITKKKPWHSGDEPTESFNTSLNASKSAHFNRPEAELLHLSLTSDLSSDPNIQEQRNDRSATNTWDKDLSSAESRRRTILLPAEHTRRKLPIR